MWRWFREEPLRFVIGLVIAAAAAYGTWYWLGDYRAYGSQPLAVSLDEAVRAATPHRQWVAVADAAWDCPHFRRSGPHSYVPARTRDGALVVLHTQHQESCAQLTSKPAVGILEPLSPAEVRQQHSDGLPGTDVVVWELAGVDFHPRQNALYGVLACAGGVLFGLFLVPIAALCFSLQGRALDWYGQLLVSALSRGRKRDEPSPALLGDLDGRSSAPPVAVAAPPPAAAVALQPLPTPTPVDEETRRHVASLWERIHAHLAANDSFVLARLGPPATEAQISALEEAIGCRLPADYRASLAIHDGQKEGFVGAMDGLSLHSLEETLQDWRAMEALLRAGDFGGPCDAPAQGLQAGWWNRGWLPIAGDSGNSLNIDLAPAADGVVGQLFFFDHEQGAGPVRANSFAAWLEQVAAQLESGQPNNQ